LLIESRGRLARLLRIALRRCRHAGNALVHV
jgi:hypothetical protein